MKQNKEITIWVTLKFREKKKFINRGFLIGPYCPIYGYGAVTINDKKQEVKGKINDKITKKF